MNFDVIYSFFSGTITANSWWTTSQFQSLNGTVTVNSGKTLTVLPGATKYFPANALLDIYGTLNVNGTASQPVTFDKMSSWWDGIWYRLNSKGSISYANINYATKGLRLYAKITASNCTIQNFTEQGIYIMSAGNPTVQNCTIINNAGGSHGIQAIGSTDNPSILNNEVSSGAVGIGRRDPGGPVLISGNNIHNCTKGVQITDAAPEIVNNLIDACSHGVYLATGSSANIHDNDILQNAIGVNVAQSQPSSLKWNILYANSTANLQINYLLSGNSFVNYQENNFYTGSSGYDVVNNTTTTLNARGNFWYYWGYNYGPVDALFPLEYENPNAGRNGQTGKSTQEEEPPPAVLPEKFFLTASFPNPLSLSGGANYIRFDLPERATVELAIYDLQGKLVRSLASKQNFEAGRRELAWDGKNDNGHAVGSGIYFYRLQAVGLSSGKRFADARKLTVVR
jgi:parallel beta-helix repeat protein